MGTVPHRRRGGATAAAPLRVSTGSQSPAGARSLLPLPSAPFPLRQPVPRYSSVPDREPCQICSPAVTQQSGKNKRTDSWSLAIYRCVYKHCSYPCNTLNVNVQVNGQVSTYIRQIMIKNVYFSEGHTHTGCSFIEAATKKKCTWLKIFLKNKRTLSLKPWEFVN